MGVGETMAEVNWTNAASSCSLTGRELQRRKKSNPGVEVLDNGRRLSLRVKARRSPLHTCFVNMSIHVGPNGRKHSERREG